MSRKDKFNLLLNEVAEVIRVIGSLVAVITIGYLSIVSTGLSAGDMVVLAIGSLIFCGLCFAIAWLLTN